MVPTSTPGAVTESDKPAREAHGVKFLGNEDSRDVFEVDAGRYRFSAPLKP